MAEIIEKDTLQTVAFLTENNIFQGLSRIEFGTKLDSILFSTFNFPRTVDAIFDDPGLLLIISFVAMILAFTLMFLSTRRRYKKKVELSDSNSSVTSSISPPRKIIKDPVTSPRSKLQTVATPQKSESVNTEIDIDEFMNRLFASGIVVTRHKPNNVIKSRCLKLNDQCDLCIFKQFKRKNRLIQPTGGPYMRIPLRELRDCFPCEGSNPPTFILDFSNKTIQLSADFVLDNHYLVQGFKGLLHKIKKQPDYLQSWTQRFQQRLTSSRSIKSKSGSSFFFFNSPSKSQQGDDDDIQSVSTINTMITR